MSDWLPRVILAPHKFQVPEVRFNRALQRAHDIEGRHMANNNDEDVPFMQKLLDNHFLLLFLGVASPGVLYILWGIIDIMSVPLAK
jgi:hypothetical protein